VRQALSGCNVVGIDNLNEYYDVKLKKDRLKLLSEKKNKKAVDRIFETYRPSYVINLAAQAGVRYSIENPYAYVDSNLVGFVNILEACRKYPVKHLIYASSSSVYVFMQPQKNPMNCWPIPTVIFSAFPQQG